MNMKLVRPIIGGTGVPRREKNSKTPKGNRRMIHSEKCKQSATAAGDRNVWESVRNEEKSLGLDDKNIYMQF